MQVERYASCTQRQDASISQGLNRTQRVLSRFSVQCKYWSYCGGSAGCDGACHRAVLHLNYTASSLCRRDDSNWPQCVAPS